MPRKRKFLLTTLILMNYILFNILFSIANAQNVNTYIPERAFEYRDEVYKQIKQIVPELPNYNFVGSLVEHESCISLNHSRCWSATSELRNSREHSIGFFQIARAFNPDGSVRMDTLSSLKNKYLAELGDASWGNLKQRPDLQMKAGLLLIKENYKTYWMIDDPFERMAFTDNAYNGGMGWVNRERKACGLRKDCDPNKWFDNVELACQRSKKPISNYGNRSICDISRNHTKDVLKIRLDKYNKQYFNEDYIKQMEK